MKQAAKGIDKVIAENESTLVPMIANIVNVHNELGLFAKPANVSKAG